MNNSLNDNQINNMNTDINNNINNMNNQSEILNKNYLNLSMDNSNNAVNLNAKDKKNNKLFLIIIIGIVLVTGLIVGYILFNKEEKSSSNLNIIVNNPILIKDDDKYGYITSEGKMLITPMYDIAYDFNGKYAVVKKDADSLWYQMIDAEGKVVLDQAGVFAPEYYEDLGIWNISGELYDNELNKISPEGYDLNYIGNGFFEFSDFANDKEGIMNTDGELIYSVTADYINVVVSDNEYSDDLYAMVKIEDSTDRVEIVSLKNGKILYEMNLNDDIKFLSDGQGIFYYFNDGEYNKKNYLVFMNDKLVYKTTQVLQDLYFIDYNNKVLLMNYGYDYSSMGKDQPNYYLDLKNNEVLKHYSIVSGVNTDYIEDKYGFSEYKDNYKYGLQKNGKVILSPQYNEIEYLELPLFNYLKNYGKELVFFEKDDNVILYDVKKLKEIRTFEASYYRNPLSSIFVNFYLDDGNLIYNLLNDKSITLDSCDNLSFKAHYFICEESNKTKYYNADMKEVYVVNE